MNNIKFKNAKDFIAWVEKQKRFSPKVSLDKMRFYLSLFDNPHEKIKCIHVTGTNGKGSVVAFLKSILRKAGFNVATFTSPYITCFNERIAYNEDYISDEELLLIGNQIIDKFDVIEQNGYDLPTFFEFITILAFVYYSKLLNLDYVILEVGMGGRLDATNVVTPLLSVITNISLEHTAILGDTLEKIAFEKLGIVKNNSYLVSGKIDNSLISYFDNYCLEKNSIHIKSMDNDFTVLEENIDCSKILLNGVEFEIGLIGKHQIENAICAYTTLETLKNIDKKCKNKITNEIYYRGFKDATWQGRLEKLSKEPLILIDGCHNKDGVNRVCNFINSLDYKFKRAIVSISADKDIKEMVEMIGNTFDEVVITKYSYLRSSDVETIDNLLNHHNKKIINSVDLALKYCEENPVELSIFMGSLYLVSEVRNIKKPLK